MSEVRLEGKLIKRRWRLLRCIGTGAFGQVYSAIDLNAEKKVVAIKLEENKKVEKLKTEALILRCLADDEKSIQGIPQAHWFGTDNVLNQYNYMVTDMLGPSLEDLFNICSRKFSLKTVLMIAEQCLNRLEYIHYKNYVHRDIKPENFLMGLGNNSHIIYAIDFGLAQKYRDSKTLCHIMFKENRSLVGTARYLSLNAHLGIEQSRRDDLESLGYMLIYFLKGSLPWQGIDSPNKLEKYQKIGEKKLKLPIEFYTNDLPEEITIYMNYCRNLLFDEKPDYAFLKRLFNNLFAIRGFLRDYKYDWTDPAKIDHNIIEEKNIPLIYGEIKGSRDKMGSSLESKESQSVDSFSNSEHNIYDDQSFSVKNEDERKDDSKINDMRGFGSNEMDQLNAQSKKPSIFKNYGMNDNSSKINNDEKNSRMPKSKDREKKRDTITIDDESQDDEVSDSDTIEESELNNSKEDFIVKRN